MERELQEQRNFLSRELNARTDETLQLMRQIDVLTADLKKLTAHSLYLETSKGDLETRLVERQRELDEALREKRLTE